MLDSKFAKSREQLLLRFRERGWLVAPSGYDDEIDRAICRHGSVDDGAELTLDFIASNRVPVLFGNRDPHAGFALAFAEEDEKARRFDGAALPFDFDELFVTEDPVAFFHRLGSNAGAALGAAAGKYFPAVVGGHPGAEASDVPMFDLGRLIRFLHVYILRKCVRGDYSQPRGTPQQKPRMRVRHKAKCHN